MLNVARSMRVHWRVWAYLALTLITVGIVFFYPPPATNGPEYDRHVRLWALTLQLLGTATVWWDLTHTAEGYGAGPSFRKAWESIKSALGMRPSVPGRALIAVGAEMRISGGRVSVWVQPQTVEARLANLEQFVRRLDSELGTIHGTITQQNDKQTADLKRLNEELHREVKRLEGKLQEALIGNFATLHFGVIWLVVGMLLASAPVEITNLSAWLGLFNLFQ
ncbi:hypothetical protein [Massilia sp. GCM10023247]|uniref:hypothetical protein n=1 Tax=Massilia sp. GCM10023247 TaxID=3252643 RepID=UPI003613E780